MKKLPWGEPLDGIRRRKVKGEGAVNEDERERWAALVNVFWQADHVLTLRLRGVEIEWEEWMLLKDHIHTVAKLEAGRESALPEKEE